MNTTPDYDDHWETKARQENEATRDHALQVACPDCGEPAGVWCRNGASGQPLGAPAHIGRIRGATRC